MDIIAIPGDYTVKWPEAQCVKFVVTPAAKPGTFLIETNGSKHEAWYREPKGWCLRLVERTKPIDGQLILSIRGIDAILAHNYNPDGRIKTTTEAEKSPATTEK